MRKVAVVAHGPPEEVYSDPTLPHGLVGLSRHDLYDGAPAEHPDDVHGVWMVWLQDDVDPLEAARMIVKARSITAYLVDEHVQWDYERDWPAGDPTPGVKRISFIRRLPTLTRAEFATHWTDVHAPLARVHHPAIWRYVQNVVVEAITPDAPDVDGIAELHFRTYDDLVNRMYDSDDGRDAVQADVRRFIDTPRGWRILNTERIIL
jgi:uncharacterized protein (TIGR02118 family)